MGLQQHLILIGPMGAGKSTIGRCISESLKSEFIDLDKLIEERAGASIPWIFDIEGEEGFRERESQALAHSLDLPSCIIATGGGCILRPENREALSSRGFVVYLSASIEQQLERTSKDKNRPLLQSDDPAIVLARLAKIRIPLYQMVCHLEIDTNAKPPRMVVEEILQFIQVEHDENIKC